MITIHACIVLRGTDVPLQNVEALLAYAAECGFEVVPTATPGGDIVDLQGHLQAELQRLDHLSYWTNGCLSAYQGLSLYSMSGMELNHFMMGRHHKPYQSMLNQWCGCLRLQSIVLQLMIDRGLRFTDCDPATLFTTRIDTSGLPTRTLGILEFHVGIMWLEQCSYLTQQDIAEMWGAGAKTLDTVEARLGAKLPQSWR